MARTIIFGAEDFAQLAFYYLRTDSSHEVVAFCLDSQYLNGRKSFEGLPIVPFEEVGELYPPDQNYFFAPMSPKKMNTIRESIFQKIKCKGYSFISYISSKAMTFDNSIGENCFILEGNVIQPFVTLKDNIILWSGNHLGHHSTIDSHTMFASHVVLSGHCQVGKNCFLGVNATIRDGLEVKKGTLLAMSASLYRSTEEEWGVYTGNPALRKGTRNSQDVY